MVTRLGQFGAKAIVLSLWFLLAGSCVYYNTFFHARQAFEEAESARKASKTAQPTIRTEQYNRAIEKSLKVIESYPNSKYYDDAVYVLAVSYYHTKQYRKSERRSRELLANFPDSKYATEAKLYLAKAKLAEDDVEEAMKVFEDLLDDKVDRDVLSEATIALGTYHAENNRYDVAVGYFRAVRDSLGNEQQAKAAQGQIADAYFHMYRFKDALGAYLQILGMEPDNSQRYRSLYQAAICSYRLQQVRAGIDYLQSLISDEMFFDSLGVLKLRLAEGYELEDDLDQAVAIYEAVAAEEKIKKVGAEANYNLGLIYQFDYDRLQEAKKYYDKVVELNRSSEMGQDALQRSSDIGKLESFVRAATTDSITTQETIDKAAATQYELAELYWFKLNKPDSAILEMRYLVDSFPTAYTAPKGMIALSQMTREREEDTARADSILRAALQKYPHSDFAPEALSILGLTGTPADTGYADLYISRAEHFVVEEPDTDSARVYYQYVVDHFPDSRYYLQARFALIWLTEEYASPGDSSLILAYSELADSFPGTVWATEATKRSQYRPQARPSPGDSTDTNLTDQEAATDSLAGDTTGLEDTATYQDPMAAIYVAEDGSKAYDLPHDMRPIVVRDPFEYPTEAYASAWHGDLYFQIRLDFTGEVIQYVLKTHSPVPELDQRAEITVASTTFDPKLLRPEVQGLWFVYKFRVDLPPHLR